jgi:hypothetical protein
MSSPGISLPNIGPDEIVISVGGEFFRVPKRVLQSYRVRDVAEIQALRNLGSQIRAGSVGISAGQFRGDWVAGVRG